MIDTIFPALADALVLLADLHRDGTQPDQAHGRLRELNTQYPNIRMDLVSEVESYDGRAHYDVLLRKPGEGTVSLALSPEPSLPWPMRGAQRWSEGHLMRVNGKVVRVAQAVALMDIMWQQAPIANRLINATLVQEELDRNPITLPPEQVMHAMDAFRRRRGLFTAEATLAWMRDQGATAEHLEQLVTDEALLIALRDRVVDDRIEPHFEEHRDAFATAHLVRAVYPDEASAREALDSVRAETVDLLTLLTIRYLADPTSGGEVFASVRRGEMPIEMGDAIFGASPGQVIGPFPQPDGSFTIVQVLKVTEPRLDPLTGNAIRQALFEAWLAERRHEATIEWYWGAADRGGED